MSKSPYHNLVSEAPCHGVYARSNRVGDSIEQYNAGVAPISAERGPEEPGVGGSNPPPGTRIGLVAQRLRAMDAGTLGEPMSAVKARPSPPFQDVVIGLAW